MISFDILEHGALLRYELEIEEGRKFMENLGAVGVATIKRTFTLRESDLQSIAVLREDAEYRSAFHFLFAKREDGYFRIEGRKLGIPNTVFIADEGIDLGYRLFVAARGIRTFRCISDLVADCRDIVVGGKRSDAIPIDAFLELIRRLPNYPEIARQVLARVEAYIGEFISGAKSAKENYDAYLAKRTSRIGGRDFNQEMVLESEIMKFEYLLDTMTTWLRCESAHDEREWQKMIREVICLVYPKYVTVLEEVSIEDFYSKPGQTGARRIDLCMVDYAGNIDIIEIKKPSENILKTWSHYRDNNLPAIQLSGSIMQAEKYIFHLSKWGFEGERKLTERYRKMLPDGMSIRITNPKAMVILGRDTLPNGNPAFSESEQLDLEIIKRKYANMIDVLTYDDLLRRLERVIGSFSRRKGSSAR